MINLKYIFIQVRKLEAEWKGREELKMTTVYKNLKLTIYICIDDGIKPMSIRTIVHKAQCITTRQSCFSGMEDQAYLLFFVDGQAAAVDEVVNDQVRDLLQAFGVHVQTH